MEGNGNTFQGDVGVSKPMKRRPNSVTVLALFILFIAFLNLIRIIQAIVQWQFLTGVLSYTPVYPLLSGIVWSILGLTLFLGAWRGWRKSPIFITLGGVFYSIYYWIDHFALSTTPFDSNWLFILIINGLIMITIVWFLTRGNTKAYFGEAHDPGTQDQGIT
jgi:hypothetical protein